MSGGAFPEALPHGELREILPSIYLVTGAFKMARPPLCFSRNMMGFIKPHNIGPGWLKMAKPSASELRGIHDLPFEHVLPSHGTPVLGVAKAAYRSAIDRAARVAG